MIQEAKSHHFLHPEVVFNAEVEQFVSLRQNFFTVAIYSQKCPLNTNATHKIYQGGVPLIAADPSR